MIRQMKNLIVCAVLMTAAVFLMSSCDGKESRVIPEDSFSRIYAEMFITDQWINANPRYRRKADTMWVYEPVFEKYGYTADDYRASVEYYLQEPDRFATILKESSLILEEHLAELKNEKARQEEQTQLEQGISMFRPESLYRLSVPDLSSDDAAALLQPADSLTYWTDAVDGETGFRELIHL